MLRAREKHEIVVGVRLLGDKVPTLNPPGKGRRCLSLGTVRSFVVIMTGAPGRIVRRPIGTPVAACMHATSDSLARAPTTAP